MTENDLFNIIDRAIETFKQNEEYRKRIKVNKKPHSDWLVFHWRQLTWKDNGLEYLIELYPEFDAAGTICSWTLYAAVYYDENETRYYASHKAADKTSLQFIAGNITELISSSYKHITIVKKEDILPAAN
jgi:hypothetical protein